jgi:hypothetical protein
LVLVLLSLLKAAKQIAIAPIEMEILFFFPLKKEKIEMYSGKSFLKK